MFRNNATTFLSATWSDLVFLSFKAPEEVLKPYLPHGLVFDRFEGSPITSLVAFQFLESRFCGMKPPLFHSFAELNLRFYVRTPDDQYRGVVFIKEICPFRSVALTAKLFYNESFLVMPCSASLAENSIDYRFGDSRLAAAYTSPPSDLSQGDLAHFTVDRHHGFSRWREDRTLHYTVSHEPWLVRDTKLTTFDLDLKTFYGPALAEVLQQPPSCVVSSPGSKITLSCGALYGAKTSRRNHWGRVWGAACRPDTRPQ